MKPPSFTLELGLASYLTKIRSIVLPGKSSASNAQTSPKLSLILGNPSCDLDSFISACVLSYFYNCKANTGASDRLWVPILNLTDVPSNDLWRLRPEFGAALNIAVSNENTSEGQKESQEQSKSLLEQLVTIHDLQRDKSAIPGLRDVFRNMKQTETKPDVILVDHNAPAIPGLDDETIHSNFNVVGCIDHHVDEGYVDKSAEPRIVTSGIGSCTSLVVQYLRDKEFWVDTKPQLGQEQIAKLGMASILIDTTNLKALGDKCSDTDRNAIDFLQRFTGQSFNRDELFQKTAKAKSESLNLLKMSEILARDYKDWTESVSAEKDTEITVGISSLVKPLSWLTKHTGSNEIFVDELLKHARKQEKPLGVLCLLTRADDSKEVIVVSLNELGKKGIERFEKSADELKLKSWNEDASLAELLDSKVSDGTISGWKIWWMGDVSKSRKQVGPLLRAAVRDAK